MLLSKRLLNGDQYPVQGHRYRNVVGLRHGASTSLIELTLASHAADSGAGGDRVPPGLAFWTLQAQMRELELFFLNRFLQAGTSFVRLLTWAFAGTCLCLCAL
jgi:hypothetical protein